MFVVLEKVDDGFIQAHGRNKTYKTIDGAIDNGVHQFGGPDLKIVMKGEDFAVVKYLNRLFAIVDVGDFAIQRALMLNIK